ncbi:mechanosensitive ion channel family protein [Chlorobium sp. KB01]|uniref:mechanosensitive ion channel family protein n=1 Tax=Chlorobium sp. KB01 TaxID=1917528 RepID=UPI0009782B55|nr:mechanosensitive ion channel domain-containing protein [Chlorobium sp. KB01]
MDSVAEFWSLLQGPYLIPAVIFLLATLFYLAANTLFRKVIAAVRFSLKGVTVPYELMAWPFRMLITLIGLSALLHSIALPAGLHEILRHALLIVAVIAVAWFMMRLFRVFEHIVLQHYSSRVRENEAARKISTHVSLARKILNVLIVLLGVSSVLMTFDTVRQVGLSILASAGIAGVILGFAAQKSLATLVAGIQIAITQPISIGDVVVVENEWGRIDEITLTYVVVQLWDQRRLIVPITWFIDRPFQNWTRTSPELLGTVLFSMDYLIPPDTIRTELERIVALTPLWDKRVVKLHVTNTTERSVQMRALVSAANSSDLWELRCFVREALIEFLRARFPEGLPKLRMEMERNMPPGEA